MAGFRRGLDSTGQAMKRMAKVGAVMTVAAAAGLAYMVKRQMEAIDVIAKLSDRLGIATEDLVGLQHAASISGVSTEALNKSLDMFVRRLGEMTMGSGEAQRGLEMLGLTTEELIRLSPAEAMGIAADRINRLETQAEKAAAAYFLFGRAGAQLVTMFAVGSEGMREFQREAERLGLTFSRFDAAQIEAANDALTRARATMTGLFRQITIELAPYIEVLADKFTDVATAGEGLGANVVNAFESMSMAAIRFGSLIQTLPAYWKGVEAGARESLAAVYDLAAKATNLDVLFKKLKRPGWEKTYKELAAEQRQIAAGLLKKGGRELAGTYGQENAVRRFYDDLRKKAASGRAAMEVEARQRSAAGVGISPVADLAEISKGVEASVEASLKRIEAEDAAAKEIDKIWTEMWLKQEETAWHAMRAPIIAAEELAEESAERRKRIAEDIALSMASSWSNAFDQMMFEGKKFWDAMEDMARSLFREIVKITMYKKLAEPMAYGIMGLPVPAYQHGTITTSPHLAMVGEVPEAIVPLSGGRSIPVEMRGGGGGRGGVTINVNNVPETYEISEAEEYMLGDERIINVFMQKIQTNGPLRRSIKQIRS